MPSHADAIDAPMTLSAETPARYCAHCGVPGPAPGHPCQAPSHLATGRNIWHDLAAVRGALLLYFSIIAATVLGVIATATDLTTDPNSQVAADVGSGVAISMVVIFACLFSRDRLIPVLATIGPWRWYVVAPALALGTFGIAQLACASLDDVFGLPQMNYSNPYLASGWGWWLPVLVVVIQPAVFEELAFRGVMTSSLQPALGPRETLFLVALLFAIIHLNPLAFVHLFVAGLALGALRNFSGSLYPGMLLHLCHNGFALMQEYAS